MITQEEHRRKYVALKKLNLFLKLFLYHVSIRLNKETYSDLFWFGQMIYIKGITLFQTKYVIGTHTEELGKSNDIKSRRFRNSTFPILYRFFTHLHSFCKFGL